MSAGTCAVGRPPPRSHAALPFCPFVLWPCSVATPVATSVTRADHDHERGHVQQRAPGVRHAVAVLLVFRRRVHRVSRQGRRHAIYAARRCRPKPFTGGCDEDAACAGQLGCRCAKTYAIQNVRLGAARHNHAQVYVAMQLGGHRPIAHRPPARGAGNLGHVKREGCGPKPGTGGCGWSPRRRAPRMFG
eukprot:355910-Chlamydomonas_euryale.AAC.3